MSVHQLSRYPRDVALRDESCATLRPMTAADVEPLLAFFLRIPEEERFFLKDDVTAPGVIQSWAQHLDYDRALPLLAWNGDQIVGDATLLRRRGGSRRHAGEIRVTIDPDYRRKGLGVTMMRELVEIAYDAELEMALFELVQDVQDEAIEAARYLGAFETGRVSEFVKDMHGTPHDLVYLRLPLGKWWEWSQF